MSNKTPSVSEGILMFIILFVITLPLGVFLDAWALTKLWDWFIIPQFHLDELTYVGAAGLSLILGVLTHQDLSNVAKKPSEDSLWVTVFSALGKVIFKPLFILAFAKFAIWLL